MHAHTPPQPCQPHSKRLRRGSQRRQRARRRRAQAGITLLEVLIAAFLLGMLGLATVDTISRAHSTKELLVELNDQYHGARVVLDRMCRELTMAFITKRITTGDQSRVVQTIFLGEDASPVSKLTFTSFSHVRMVRDTKESDQNVVSYYGKPNPKKRGAYFLFRREKTPIDAKPEEGGVAHALLDNVLSLQIRYWDRQKTDWTNEWDTRKIENANKIPPLVEIKLTLQDPHGKKTVILTRAKVFMSEVITR